ncbi:STM3941 family protein [Pseudonocardia sp. DLS-67]
MSIQRFGRPGSGDERVVVFPSRAKLALMSVGSLAFVIGAAFMVSEGGLTAIKGALGIVFFAACGGCGIWRLAAPRPVLVIDRLGIHGSASAAGGGWIPWSEITGCGVRVFRWQRWVGIDLVDPAAYRARLNPVGRWAARLNPMFGLPPVMIPQSILPLSAGEMVAEIEWFRSQAFGR